MYPFIHPISKDVLRPCSLLGTQQNQGSFPVGGGYRLHSTELYLMLLGVHTLNLDRSGLSGFRQFCPLYLCEFEQVTQLFFASILVSHKLELN